jgi:hypothetical protein
MVMMSNPVMMNTASRKTGRIILLGSLTSLKKELGINNYNNCPRSNKNRF